MILGRERVAPVLLRRVASGVLRGVGGMLGGVAGAGLQDCWLQLPRGRGVLECSCRWRAVGVLADLHKPDVSGCSHAWPRLCSCGT